METAYFKTYLQTYLSDHGFEPEVMESDLVVNNIKQAERTYETSLDAGYPGDGAKELALKELFNGIGDSPREVLVDLIGDRFNERLGIPDGDFMTVEFWIKRIGSDMSLMQDFLLENGLGLDPEVNEGSRSEEFIARIDQYLTTHGF